MAEKVEIGGGGWRFQKRFLFIAFLPPSLYNIKPREKEIPPSFLINEGACLFFFLHDFFLFSSQDLNHFLVSFFFAFLFASFTRYSVQARRIKNIKKKGGNRL